MQFFIPVYSLQYRTALPHLRDQILDCLNHQLRLIVLNVVSALAGDDVGAARRLVDEILLQRRPHLTTAGFIRGRFAVAEHHQWNGRQWAGDPDLPSRFGDSHYFRLEHLGSHLDERFHPPGGMPRIALLCRQILLTPFELLGMLRVHQYQACDLLGIGSGV